MQRIERKTQPSRSLRPPFLGTPLVTSRSWADAGRSSEPRAHWAPHLQYREGSLDARMGDRLTSTETQKRRSTMSQPVPARAAFCGRTPVPRRRAVRLARAAAGAGGEGRVASKVQKTLSFPRAPGPSPGDPRPAPDLMSCHRPLQRTCVEKQLQNTAEDALGLDLF